MGPLNNAANRTLFDRAGTIPDVSGALQDYFQPMQFWPLTKTVTGFQVLENANPMNFQGTWQPFSDEKLLLKPEGQRSWPWYELHADDSLKLNVDDVVLWNGTQTRVMDVKHYGLYGYVRYHLIQDYSGAGP